MTEVQRRIDRLVAFLRMYSSFSVSSEPFGQAQDIAGRPTLYLSALSEIMSSSGFRSCENYLLRHWNSRYPSIEGIAITDLYYVTLCTPAYGASPLTIGYKNLVHRTFSSIWYTLTVAVSKDPEIAATLGRYMRGRSVSGYGIAHKQHIEVSEIYPRLVESLPTLASRVEDVIVSSTTSERTTPLLVPCAVGDLDDAFRLSILVSDLL